MLKVDKYLWMHFCSNQYEYEYFDLSTRQYWVLKREQNTLFKYYNLVHSKRLITFHEIEEFDQNFTFKEQIYLNLMVEKLCISHVVSVTDIMTIWVQVCGAQLITLLLAFFAGLWISSQLWNPINEPIVIFYTICADSDDIKLVASFFYIMSECQDLQRHQPSS